MNPLAITMLSQKKLNTYSVESPCERLPGVGSFLANPRLSKTQLRTELRGENIHYGEYIHGNIGTKFITLRHCNSHHG